MCNGKLLKISSFFQIRVSWNEHNDAPNSMCYNNTMVYGQQQINTTINYVIPQYWYIPYTYNYEPGYISFVECIDIAIQTDNAENVNKSSSVLMVNAEYKSVAIQSVIETESISIQTINVENKDIEIQSNLFTFNSIAVQTNIK